MRVFATIVADDTYQDVDKVFRTPEEAWERVEELGSRPEVRFCSIRVIDVENTGQYEDIRESMLDTQPMVPLPDWRDDTKVERTGFIQKSIPTDLVTRKKKMKKKMVEKELETLHMDSFEGEVSDVIRMLEDLRDKYREFDAVRLRDDTFYDSSYVTVLGRRFETDDEYEKRLARSKKAREAGKKRKAKKTEKELKEYRRLQKKYGHLNEEDRSIRSFEGVN